MSFQAGFAGFFDIVLVGMGAVIVLDILCGLSSSPGCRVIGSTAPRYKPGLHHMRVSAELVLA